MTTINELIYKYNLPEISAKQSYSYMLKRIGYTNGINKITDIDYLDDLHKQVQLTCTECGNISYQVIRKGKWNKVRKTCPCQKEWREAILKNLQKSKRASAIEKARKHLGKQYGDYEIVDINTSGKDIKAIARCTTCGNEVVISAITLDRGWKSTRCTKHTVTVKFDESYIGKKNNRLTVIGLDRAENGDRRFRCRCECGNETLVSPTFWGNRSNKELRMPCRRTKVRAYVGA